MKLKGVHVIFLCKLFNVKYRHLFIFFIVISIHLGVVSASEMSASAGATEQKMTICKALNTSDRDTHSGRCSSSNSSQSDSHPLETASGDISQIPQASVISDSTGSDDDGSSSQGSSYHEHTSSGGVSPALVPQMGPPIIPHFDLPAIGTEKTALQPHTFVQYPADSNGMIFCGLSSLRDCPPQKATKLSPAKSFSAFSTVPPNKSSDSIDDCSEYGAWIAMGKK